MAILKLWIILIYLLKPFDARSDINLFNENTYYVSPNGKDSNPGTSTLPWRSIRVTAERLKAGDRVIIENGIYHESSQINIKNSGTISKPIVIEARNKHKAIVVFSLPHTVSRPKINIENVSNVIIKGLTITQNNPANNKTPNNTFDIVIACRNSQNCSFLDNKIHNAFEEGIKVSRSNNIRIENNIFFDFQHEAIDLLNVSNTVVKNNIIKEIGRVGIMVKGGSRNIQILDNIVENSKTIMTTAGITIGGMTDMHSTYDSKTGFEAYNVIAMSNKIVSKTPGLIQNGIAFMGAKDSYAYNNNIVGAQYGIMFMTVESKKYGWDNNTKNIKIELKNNIIIDSKKSAYFVRNKPTEMQSDHNLFYNNKSSPIEPNSKYVNPAFIDKYSNWDFKDRNKVIGLGAEIPSSFNGFKGTVINVRKNVTSLNRKFGAE